MANIKGVAKWPKLGIPKDNYDEYNNNGKKNYTVDLYVTDDELTKFESQYQAAYDTIETNPKYQKNGNPQEYPKEMLYTPTRVDKDGKKFIKFTTKAFTDDGEQKTFPLFDSKLVPLDKQMANGSVVQVNYSLAGVRNNVKNAGVCAYMNAICVDKLVEFGSKGTPDSFGFDVEAPADSYGFSGTEEENPI
jgi:hypothetical protein